MRNTYAIGDVQGCFDELCALLEKISYDPLQDELWFVGDLVNRGPKSLETLRFIKQQPHVKIVLGNHDLHLLALASGYSYSHHSLHKILTAPDRDELIAWLRKLPLLYHDPNLNFVMVHAGLPPQWDLAQAKQCARELETVLQQNHLLDLMQHLYGNQPDQWRDDLQGWDRLRFITNAFTRMRFCDAQGKLDLKTQGKIGSQPSGFMPWYQVPNRRTQHDRIVFGHWAALLGETNTENVFAVDTGCVWGNSLTALRLNDLERFAISCDARGQAK